MNHRTDDLKRLALIISISPLHTSGTAKKIAPTHNECMQPLTYQEHIHNCTCTLSCIHLSLSVCLSIGREYRVRVLQCTPDKDFIDFIFKSTIGLKGFQAQLDSWEHCHLQYVSSSPKEKIWLLKAINIMQKI